MRFEGVVQLHDEGVIQLRADVLFVFDYILFLCTTYKLFEHHLHGIELAISLTPY